MHPRMRRVDTTSDLSLSHVPSIHHHHRCTYQRTMLSRSKVVEDRAMLCQVVAAVLEQRYLLLCAAYMFLLFHRRLVCEIMTTR